MKYWTTILLLLIGCGEAEKAAPTTSNIGWKVGDCFIYKEFGTTVYQILEIGNYSVKIIDEYGNIFYPIVTEDKSAVATQTDCWNKFDKLKNKCNRKKCKK